MFLLCGYLAAIPPFADFSQPVEAVDDVACLHRCAVVKDCVGAHVEGIYQTVCRDIPGISKRRLDAAVLDYAMPDGNSVEWLPRLRAAGGRPDGWIFQTWYKFPEKAAPEEQPFTMTWLAKEAIRKLRPGAR